jgi:hypothetical protein
MAIFTSIEIKNCGIGIDLARSYDLFGDNDETSSSGWNAWTGGKEGGFYHNVVTFTQVHVSGGEIGIRVTGMDVSFIGVCTEGMDVTANSTDNNLPWPKQILQPNDVGVGLWLENGDCNRSDAGGNNVIIDFYR